MAETIRGQLMQRATFSTHELVAMSGATLRQLQWWDERKIVTARVRGHRRYYEPAAAIEVMILADLREKGLSLQSIRRLLRQVRNETGLRMGRIGDRGELYFVTDGFNGSFAESGEAAAMLVSQARRPMYVTFISEKAKRIRELAKMRAN